MKAQYEVLGNNAKRDVRPGRDDRSVLAPGPLVCGFTSVSNRRSSRSSLVILTMGNKPCELPFPALSALSALPALPAFPTAASGAIRRNRQSR